MFTTDALNKESIEIQKRLRQQDDPDAEIRLRELLYMKEVNARVGMLLLNMEEMIHGGHVIKHSANYKRLKEMFYD